MIHSSEADVQFNTIYYHDIGIQAQEAIHIIPTDAIIKNNIITNNEVKYLEGATWCNIYCPLPLLNPLKISFNDVWNPLYGWNYSNCGPIEGDIQEDPQFVNPDIGDFHLKETSPCLTKSSEGGEIGAYGNGGTPGVGIKLPLLQQMEVILRVMDYIPEDCFKTPNYKKVLMNRFKVIERKLQKAEESENNKGQYQSSLNIINNTILTRTNGCEYSENPDNNDWIIDCKAQEWIHSLLFNLIETLEKKLM